MSDLKTVVSIDGQYSLRNFTVFDIRTLKGRKQLTKTLPLTTEEAAAAEAAGIDTLNVRYDPLRPEQAIKIRQAAPKTFMTFAMPMQAASSKSKALEVCFKAMEDGADSIMCGSWCLDFIAAAANSGIPVEGHIGLVPRKSTWTGGLRAVGKTNNEVETLYNELILLQDAGAWAVEIEVVPENILNILAKETELVVTSIGSGNADIQFLFAEDILGDSKAPFPRHSKQYADFFSFRKKAQNERIKAFRSYISDVKAGMFPSTEFTVKAKSEVVSYLNNLVERKRQVNKMNGDER